MTDSFGDIRALLEEAYGLAAPSINLIGRGSLNRNYRVECPGRAYCLKQYNPLLYQPEKIRRACELQDVARQSGIPAPAVVPNAAGETVTRAGEGFYVLSEFVTGRHHDRPNIPKAAARAMGRALGSIHLALADVEAAQPYVVPEPVEALAGLEEALRRAEPRRARSAPDELCCQVLHHKIGRLQRVAHLAPRFSILRTQLTHGDYQETNVLFDSSDHVAAVLDFDNWRRQPRGAEVMRAISLCFEGEGQLLPEFEDFFAGYVEVVPLPEDEVRLFAPLRVYLSATSAWPIVERYLKPEIYQPRWDRFIKPPSDWWERHEDEVTEELVRIRASRCSGLY